MSESTLYDIIKIGVCVYLKALYIVLLNVSLCSFEIISYYITKMRNWVCLNALNIIFLKWDIVSLNAL